MSKSLNNGIDPLEVIDKYGADALRFSLAVGNKPGNDMRFYWEKVEAARNFANKIWNAARFVLMNLGDESVKPLDEVALNIADKWILTRLNQTIAEVTEMMERFDLGIAAQKLYDFTWSELCDWYLEMAKPQLYDGTAEQKRDTLSVLVHVLSDTLKMLHPFMPFITEEIYLSLPGAEETIMKSAYPVARELPFTAEASGMQDVMELIRAVRNVRADMNVPPSQKAKMTIKANHPQDFERSAEYIKRLAYASEVTIVGRDAQVDKNSVSAMSAAAEAFMPLSDLVDIAKEIERLEGEHKRLEGEIKRASGKLANESFVAKAPKNVVDAEKEKLEKYQDLCQKVEKRLETLKSM